VEYLAADTVSPLPLELVHLADLLREILLKLGRGYAHVEPTMAANAGWVANRWAGGVAARAG
jgi:hypothetical protein